MVDARVHRGKFHASEEANVTHYVRTNFDFDGRSDEYSAVQTAKDLLEGREWLGVGELVQHLENRDFDHSYSPDARGYL